MYAGLPHIGGSHYHLLVYKAAPMREHSGVHMYTYPHTRRRGFNYTRRSKPCNVQALCLKTTSRLTQASHALALETFGFFLDPGHHSLLNASSPMHPSCLAYTSCRHTAIHFCHSIAVQLAGRNLRCTNVQMHIDSCRCTCSHCS